MTRNLAIFWLIFAGLLAGHAGHWFVGGEYHEHSFVRNLLVLAQLAISLGATLWLARQARGRA